MKKDGDGRKLSHEVLEQYRLRAVELRRDGKRVKEIAYFFGVHPGSVSRWLTIHRREGRKALKSRKAKGPEPKLTQREMKQILSWLKDDAMVYGFETPLWNCKRIQQMITEKIGKRLHTTSIMRWLKRWNFTNQKPQRRASQRDEKAVKRWLREEWPKIQAHCRRWQAMLYFQDESGVSLTAVLGKTWAPKGKTPVVKVTGKKGGLCVTSAISPAGKMVFRIEKEKIKADKHIEFLQQIMKHHPKRKIIIIEDGAKPHIAKKVRDYVRQHKSHFAVYYLPSYAPELNPDEHVWAYLKAHQLKTHQAQDTEELRKLVKRKMQSIQKTNGLITSFFIGTYIT